MRDRPHLYLAAPYSMGDSLENVRRACQWAQVFRADGFVVVNPLLHAVEASMRPGHVRTLSWSDWMDQSISLLMRCDLLVWLPGKSRGRDEEIAWAKDHDIPVFSHVDRGKLTSFREGWR